MSAGDTEYSREAEKVPFSLMVKPVGSRCNLNCHYCYYRKESENSGERFERMGNAVMERLVRQYIEASPGPYVSFVWHGGEPALAGLDFYRSVVETQKRLLPEGWECWNSLQTNGTLLDDEWCGFLSHEHFDVGLSIDGTEWLHNKNRSGSFGRVSDALRRLGANGIRPDLLCAVTSEVAGEPAAVYRALQNLGTGWVQFIPIVRRDIGTGEITPDSVDGKSYGDFLCTVFDEWSVSGVGWTDVQLFAETMRVLNGGAAGLCWMSPVCGRALVAEINGDIYSCDHFVDSEHLLGNIENTHIGTLANLERQRLFGEDKQNRRARECGACRWLSVCNGGCPKDRFLPSQLGGGDLNYLCESFKRFFSYSRPAMELISDYIKRGMTAGRIREELRASQKTKWVGVGRNDPCPCGSGKKAKNCCWQRRP